MLAHHAVPMDSCTLFMSIYIVFYTVSYNTVIRADKSKVHTIIPNHGQIIKIVVAIL